MLSRIAWDLCTRAFEASRDEGLMKPMRRSLQQCGVVWFWLALTLEGRAREVWREYRADPSGSEIPVLATAITRTNNAPDAHVTRRYLSPARGCVEERAPCGN